MSLKTMFVNEMEMEFNIRAYYPSTCYSTVRKQSSKDWFTCNCDTYTNNESRKFKCSHILFIEEWFGKNMSEMFRTHDEQKQKNCTLKLLNE